MSRNAVIVSSVIGMHIAVLWAMQSGLLRRVAEVVVPAEILVEIMAPASPPPAPKATPQPQTVNKPATKSVRPVAPTPTPATAPQPAPSPLAIAPSATAPAATAAAPTATSASTHSASTSGNAPAATPAPPAPAKVERPSSDADYLNNPKPAYPAMSRRLREEGLVKVRVYIGVDGQASNASVVKSSGFERLDQASLDTVLNKWRYAPGKRDGVPEGMWIEVPLDWRLTR